MERKKEAVEGTSRIDWHRVKEQLEAARIKIEQVASPDKDETRRILQARAYALTRRTNPEEFLGERIEALEFTVAGDRYAIESTYVRDVHSLENMTPLPCVPTFLRGIVNLRGEILSVIDIRRFFGLSEKELTNLDKLIVLHCRDMRFGILVDSVENVISFSVSAIQPCLPAATGLRAEVVKGVTADRITLLEAAELLEDRGIVVQEEVPT